MNHGVADPHHFNVDPDSPFPQESESVYGHQGVADPHHMNADPDSSFPTRIRIFYSMVTRVADPHPGSIGCERPLGSTALFSASKAS
jgi:hypothetical protein